MARDASGNYTLPSGNPVASGTVISTTWANPTMTDVGTELTNSLDRSGRGGMLAALRGIDGTNVAPAVSFTSEVSSGLYRSAGATVNMVVTALETTRWVDDSATASGIQQPFEVWDGGAWQKGVYVGSPGSVPIGTLDGQTLRWEASTSTWDASSAVKITDTGNTELSGNVLFTGVTPEILGGDADGTLTIGPSTTTILGGNVVFYGQSHSTKAGDIELRNADVVKLSFDLSDAKWLWGEKFGFATGANIDAILDEDDMVSDSATALATQQSIKAFVVASSGPLTLISAAAASNDATIDFSFSGGFDEYELHLLNVIPATDPASPWIRTSTDGGSSYDFGASDYDWSGTTASGTSINVAEDDFDAQILIGGNELTGGDTNETGISCVIRIVRPSEAMFTTMYHDFTSIQNSGNVISGFGTGRRLAAEDVTNIRFLFSTGDVESGLFALYGVSRA